MGIVFRQSIKGTIVIAVGAVLGALINYWYSFIISTAELGYTRIFVIQGAVLHIFLLLGLGTTVVNFSPRYEANSEKRKVLVTLAMLASLVMAVLLAIPYFIFKEEILQFFKPEDRPLAGQYYAVVPILVFLWSYMVALESYLITQSKTAFISFVRDVVLRIINIVLIGLLFIQAIDFSTFIYGLAASYVVAVLMFFFVANRSEGFGFSFNFKIFNREEYREITSYSWYHMFVSVTLNMLGFVDVLLLGSLAPEGLSSIAAYGHAVFIVTLMVIPYRAMSSASIPTLNRVYLSQDHNELNNVFHRSAINILIAAVAMFLLISCNLDNAVAILPPEYAPLKPIALILMIGRMIDMSTGLNNEVTSISRYYKFNFRVAMLLLVMLVVLCYALIPGYGVYGAAWATTIALSLFNIAKMSFLWWKMKIQPFTKNSLVVVLCGAVAFLPGYFCPYILNPVADTLIRSLIIVICYSGLLIWLKPSKDLNDYLHNIRASKRLF